MDKLEQAVSVVMLAMGLLLIREGLSYFSPSELAAQSITRPSSEKFAIVLAGPDGIQKISQAEFLKREYGLRTIAAGDVVREIGTGRNTRFLLPDCAGGPHEAQCLAALVRQRDLPPPIFIELADYRLRRPPAPAWDVDLIQSYYPAADLWTLDGTRPPESVSATLRRLLDRPAGK